MSHVYHRLSRKQRENSLKKQWFEQHSRNDDYLLEYKSVCSTLLLSASWRDNWIAEGEKEKKNLYQKRKARESWVKTPLENHQHTDTLQTPHTSPTRTMLKYMYGLMVQWREFQFRIAFDVRKGSNISNTRDSVSSGYPNTREESWKYDGQQSICMLIKTRYPNLLHSCDLLFLLNELWVWER